MFLEKEDDEENDQVHGNNKARNLNFTATDRGTELSVDNQSNTSGYIKKDSLKDRLVKGGRWQEDLETTR